VSGTHPDASAWSAARTPASTGASDPPLANAYHVEQASPIQHHVLQPVIARFTKPA
jgi:hypothetical protein